MIRYAFLYLFTFLCLGRILAQTHTSNTCLYKQADSLLILKKYKPAARLFSMALQNAELKTDTIFLYKAITCYAAINQPDSCLQYLKLLRDAGYSGYKQLANDAALANLRKDNRFTDLVLSIKKKNLPIQPLVAEFKELLHNYQTNYNIFRLMYYRYGANAKVVQAMYQQFKYDDSITLYKVMSIVNTYGWLGKKRFGSVGPEVILISILHADLATQKKYFSVISEAAKEGDYPPEHLAFLADKIALSESGQQIYGMLIGDKRNNRFIPFTISNETEVDARRKSIGLGTLSDFLKSYNPSFTHQFYLIE